MNLGRGDQGLFVTGKMAVFIVAIVAFEQQQGLPL